MTPSVETILALAEEARRSPHARRVLFDALSERYDPFFGNMVETARAFARTGSTASSVGGQPEPHAVLLDPAVLEDAERRNRSRPPGDRHRHRDEIVDRAVWIAPLPNVRGVRRYHRRRGEPDIARERVTIVVVR